MHKSQINQKSEGRLKDIQSSHIAGFQNKPFLKNRTWESKIQQNLLVRIWAVKEFAAIAKLWSLKCFWKNHIFVTSESCKDSNLNPDTLQESYKLQIRTRPKATGIRPNRLQESCTIYGGEQKFYS